MEAVPADNLPKAGAWPRVCAAPVEGSAGLQGARGAVHSFNSISIDWRICESWEFASTCMGGERQLVVASELWTVACRAWVNEHVVMMW